jgi:acid stress-induced BolA-like protein IbaG/YrbA
MHVETLKKLIEDNLPGAIASVHSNDEVHFTAEVICPAFAGKSRIQQQQLVYHIVNPYIKSGEIHAFSLKTRTFNLDERKT